MKILLTGFETFGSHQVNPTIALVNELKKRRIEEIECLILGVGYDVDGKNVVHKIEELKPDVVLSFGLAGGRFKVCFEAVAINVRNGQITDNQGNLYKHKKISNGPLAYESNINYVALADRIKDEDFTISYHAGTFICNDVYYQELEFIRKNNLNILCGFVHIPFIEEISKKSPSLKWNRVIELSMKIIDEILEVKNV